MSTLETNKAAPASTVGDLQRKQEYEFHPIANVFPLMMGDEFKRFKKDIKSNKLREPIVIYDGKILDGRNRYNACKDLGLLPIETTPLPAGTDPVAFVVSANVHRRHLNETQRAAVAAQLSAFTHGGDRSKAPIGALTDKAAAKLLNVGERSVERAKAVLKEATPNIQALVKSGEVAVSAATEVVKLPKEKQAELTTASKVREAVKQAKQAKGEAEKKAAEGDTSKLSDEIDGLMDSLIDKLKEMKAKKPENADATVAELVRRLQVADLYTEPTKKAA